MRISECCSGKIIHHDVSKLPICSLCGYATKGIEIVSSEYRKKMREDRKPYYVKKIKNV